MLSASFSPTSHDAMLWRGPAFLLTFYGTWTGATLSVSEQSHNPRPEMFQGMSPALEGKDVSHKTFFRAFTFSQDVHLDSGGKVGIIQPPK